MEQEGCYGVDLRIVVFHISSGGIFDNGIERDFISRMSFCADVNGEQKSVLV